MAPRKTWFKVCLGKSWLLRTNQKFIKRVSYPTQSLKPSNSSPTQVARNGGSSGLSQLTQGSCVMFTSLSCWCYGEGGGGGGGEGGGRRSALQESDGVGGRLSLLYRGCIIRIHRIMLLSSELPPELCHTEVVVRFTKQPSRDWIIQRWLASSQWIVTVHFWRWYRY